MSRWILFREFLTLLLFFWTVYIGALLAHGFGF